MTAKREGFEAARSVAQAEVKVRFGKMVFEPVNLKEFGEALGTWREQLGLPRRVVAEWGEVSERTMIRIEHGESAGVRLSTYNQLAELMGIEPVLGWWDYEQTQLFVYSRGHHDVILFYHLVKGWLFEQRHQIQRADRTRMVRVGEKEALIHPDWVGYVEQVRLVRLPSTYGYMTVDKKQVGSFDATMARFKYVGTRDGR